MQKETIVVDGKKYRGYVVSSLNTKPLEIWFIFDSETMKEKFGERIGFFFTSGKLAPQDKKHAAEHTEVFRQIEKAINKFIFKN